MPPLDVHELTPAAVYAWMHGYTDRMAIFDAELDETTSTVVGAMRVAVGHDGELKEFSGNETWFRGFWRGRHVVVVHSGKAGRQQVAEVDALVAKLRADNEATGVYTIAGGLGAFRARYPFLTARRMRKTWPSFPAEVLPGLLYLGSREHAVDATRLGDLRVGTVLAADSEAPAVPGKTALVYRQAVDDASTDLRPLFDVARTTCAEAEDAGMAVLVICATGTSVAATLVASVLMQRRRWPAQLALRYLVSRHPAAAPNAAFRDQLTAFEATLQLTEGERTAADEAMLDDDVLGDPSRRSGEDLGRAETMGDGVFVRPAWSAKPPKDSPVAFAVSRDGERLDPVRLRGGAAVTFGRGLLADVQLDHASISRLHAVVVHHRDGRVFLADLGSTHGTSVDERRIAAGHYVRLYDGATVRFGASTRAYRLVGGAPALTDERKRKLDERAVADEQRAAEQRKRRALERMEMTAGL